MPRQPCAALQPGTRGALGPSEKPPSPRYPTGTKTARNAARQSGSPVRADGGRVAAARQPPAQVGGGRRAPAVLKGPRPLSLQPFLPTCSAGRIHGLLGARRGSPRTQGFPPPPVWCVLHHRGANGAPLQPESCTARGAVPGARCHAPASCPGRAA